MVTFTKNNDGLLEVIGYCDIYEEEVFLGVIRLRNGYYRFGPNGYMMLTCGHLKSICKRLSELNKG